MVKSNGWCQRILTNLGECWFIEVLDLACSILVEFHFKIISLKYKRQG